MLKLAEKLSGSHRATNSIPRLRHQSYRLRR
jgi:hypothetical protein